MIGVCNIRYSGSFNAIA